MAHGTVLNIMWQPGHKGSFGENGYVYMYGWVPLLSIWNYHSVVNWLYSYAAAAAAKSLQSCLTLCDPIDGGSPPGSLIPGILQARTLEWAAISFSNVWKWKVKVKSLSRVWLFATPWTAAYQAPSSMGFSRQEYWSGVSLPSLVLLYKVLKNNKKNQPIKKRKKSFSLMAQYCLGKSYCMQWFSTMSGHPNHLGSL